MMQERSAPAVRRSASAPLTFGILLLGELFSLRVNWYWYIVQVSFVPLSFLFFLNFLWPQSDASFYAITGSLVMTMSMSAMLSLGQHVGALKNQDAYEHYAALPISVRVFALAIATRGVILSLPALSIVGFVSSTALGFSLTPLSVLILLLGAYAMSGLGTIIGFWSPKGNTASLVTQIAQNLIILFAPVYFPIDRLPKFLQVTSALLPTTYAASGLRAAMQGAPLTEFLTEVLVLLGFAVISLVVVPLGIHWRQR